MKDRSGENPITNEQQEQIDYIKSKLDSLEGNVYYRENDRLKLEIPYLSKLKDEDVIFALRKIEPEIVSENLDIEYGFLHEYDGGGIFFKIIKKTPPDSQTR